MPPSKGRPRHESQKKKVGFFDLCTEIRCQIYEILLLDDKPIDLAPSIWKRPKRLANEVKPSIDKGRYSLHVFRICKRIHLEASWIFYSRNTFQLTVLYLDSWVLQLYPATGSASTWQPFAIQGRGVEQSPTRPVQAHNTRDNGSMPFRWDYAMPTDTISRPQIERRAMAGRRPSQIYWPAERHHSYVKKLKIVLTVRSAWNITSLLYNYSKHRMIRVGLASLFDGILPHADVELHLDLPSPISLFPESQRGEADALAFLRNFLKPFRFFGSAKTLSVTRNGHRTRPIPENDCEKLKAYIVKGSKKTDLKDRPPWRV